VRQEPLAALNLIERVARRARLRAELE